MVEKSKVYKQSRTTNEQQMNNKYQTIIWDWNGTLLNDVDLCIEIANELLKGHNGKVLDQNSYKAVFGFPITAYYQRIGIDFEAESFEELTVKFIKAYEAKVKSLDLHQNARNVLSTLQENNLDQCILTAAHKDSVLDLLEYYQLQNYFKAVEGLDNYRAESKVDRGIQLLKNNDINPDNALLVGDTMHDYEVAQAIGIDCVLISNGHQSKERLIEKTQSSEKVLEEISQLIPFLKR